LAELRARLKTCASGCILLLSILRLVMLARLENLIAGGGWGAETTCIKVPPKIILNKCVDTILDEIKSSMYRRELHQQELPDLVMEHGVTLYKGDIKGLAHISRHGDAKVEDAKYNFLLTFTLQAENIEAVSLWKKNRLKGQVKASVKRIAVRVAIKQNLPSKVPPELIAFEVMELEHVRVKMKGLGQPMNWIVRKFLCKFLKRYILDTLETDLKPMIQEELSNVKETDLPKFMKKPLDCLLLMA